MYICGLKELSSIFPFPGPFPIWNPTSFDISGGMKQDVLKNVKLQLAISVDNPMNVLEDSGHSKHHDYLPWL
eukprot:scaffold4502_cov121-Cylindrotheca_fusiformis.AAC.3